MEEISLVSFPKLIDNLQSTWLPVHLIELLLVVYYVLNLVWMLKQEANLRIALVELTDLRVCQLFLIHLLICVCESVLMAYWDLVFVLGLFGHWLCLLFFLSRLRHLDCKFTQELSHWVLVIFLGNFQWSLFPGINLIWIGSFVDQGLGNFNVSLFGGIEQRSLANLVFVMNIGALF